LISGWPLALASSWYVIGYKGEYLHSWEQALAKVSNQTFLVIVDTIAGSPEVRHASLYNLAKESYRRNFGGSKSPASSSTKVLVLVCTESRRVAYHHSSLTVDNSQRASIDYVHKILRKDSSPLLERLPRLLLALPSLVLHDIEEGRKKEAQRYKENARHLYRKDQEAELEEKFIFKWHWYLETLEANKKGIGNIPYHVLQVLLQEGKKIAKNGYPLWYSTYYWCNVFHAKHEDLKNMYDRWRSDQQKRNSLVVDLDEDIRFRLHLNSENKYKIWLRSPLEEKEKTFAKWRAQEAENAFIKLVFTLIIGIVILFASYAYHQRFYRPNYSRPYVPSPAQVNYVANRTFVNPTTPVNRADAEGKTTSVDYSSFDDDDDDDSSDDWSDSD